MSRDGTTTAGAFTPADPRRAGGPGAPDQSGERAARSGAAGTGAAGRGRGPLLYPGGGTGGLQRRGEREPLGAALQPAGAGRPAHRGRARAQNHLWSSGAGACGRVSAADARPGGGRDGYLVALDHGAGDAAGGAAAPWGDNDPPGAAGSGEFLSTDAHLVSNRHSGTQTQRWSRPGHRSPHGEKKGRIEQAYRLVGHAAFDAAFPEPQSCLCGRRIIPALFVA